MSIRLVALPAHDAQAWLDPAVHTYVTAMRYPRGTEQGRIGLWREHLARPGWTAIGALAELSPMDLRRPANARRRIDAPWTSGREVLVGVTYGYTGAPDQWWNRQLRSGLTRHGMTAAQAQALTADYFELTELHVHPSVQGRGVGAALLTGLLTGRPEAQVLLSTPEVPDEHNRAWSLYRRMGFHDVLRGFTFAGDPRPFAFLGRPLPLSAAPIPR
ncbi:GNAT family N-acetyltransferase [Gordonia phosphorivorans]|uniref:GNAT family N-acetyltransferase n=1 Tax=Gordonia phosphorivorans TaxID=1056982 RepID=A0ABV6H4M1_9ACTN